MHTFAERARLKSPLGGVPFRLTAVFQRDGQEWRLVQAHFSIGVPNA